MEEIESLLLAQETRIEKNSKDLDLDPASANLVTHGNTNRKQFKGGNSISNFQSSYSQSIHYRNNNRGRNHNQQGRNSGGRFANRNARQNWGANQHK